MKQRAIPAFPRLTWVTRHHLAAALLGAVLTLGVARCSLGVPLWPAAALAAYDDSVWAPHGAPLGRPAPRGAARAGENLAPQAFQVAATADHPAYALYAPGGPDVPRTALVVLHGIGGNGPGMAARVLQPAQARDWVVIAPTMPYGEWRDPNQLVVEELRLLPQLANLLDAAPDETGVPLADHVLLFGFSRGAQEALRFSTVFPERTQAVASLSAGTYTLPVRAVKTSAGATVAAPLPYGVADLEQRIGRSIDQATLATVRFWIGVGARDDADGDVPRQWDPFLGKNRVERAQRFSDALAEIGCQTQVVVVPGAGHELTGPMVEQALQFLAEATGLAQRQAEAATTSVPLPTPVPSILGRRAGPLGL